MCWAVLMETPWELHPWPEGAAGAWLSRVRPSCPACSTGPWSWSAVRGWRRARGQSTGSAWGWSQKSPSGKRSPSKKPRKSELFSGGWVSPASCFWRSDLEHFLALFLNGRMEVGRGKTMQTIVTRGRNVPPRVRRQQLLGLQWNEWLLLLLLSRFSHVQLCVTPQTAAYQAPQSLGFSRQEHWSGLPFPSPMHESEK